MSRILLLLFCLFLPSLALPAEDAGDTGDTGNTENESTNENNAAGQTSPAQEETAQATADEAPGTDDGLTIPEDPEDENFVPSVQINEDLPVAFPVDI